uniref:Replication-associated protein n=1 Tax=Cressdnaviricota sp. TaxID=2748378 RepID=A0A890V262_9VIRU|nr:MAG: replication-associated protein [Cressdnaviricota sp.]
MFMIMEKPIKFTVLKNAFPKAHIAMRYKQSTNKAADEYCDKEETATGKHKYKGGVFEEDQQGKRSDLELVAEAIQDGATLKAVASMFPASYGTSKCQHETS